MNEVIQEIDASKGIARVTKNDDFQKMPMLEWYDLLAHRARAATKAREQEEQEEQ